MHRITSGTVYDQKDNPTACARGLHWRAESNDEKQYDSSCLNRG